MDRTSLVLMAMVLNVVLFSAMRYSGVRSAGGISYLPGRTIRGIDRRLNRPQRTLKTRQQRGILLLAAAMLSALAAGLLLRLLHSEAVDVLLLALLLPVRQTWSTASAMHKALKGGDVAAAKEELKNTVWRHYAVLDEHSVARAAIEILAVHFSEKILAPAFWYIFLGMPGFMASKALYLLKESLCQPIASDGAFSHPAALSHFVAHYIPSRLGMALWLASVVFVPVSNPVAAARQMAKGKLDRGTPEQIALLSAAAALNLALGGPTSVYTGGEWMGGGTARAKALDIRHALTLWAVLHALLFLLVGIICL
jgi:adenosylcobinamide-phosphate synthase